MMRAARWQDKKWRKGELRTAMLGAAWKHGGLREKVMIYKKKDRPWLNKDDSPIF
jgi:hypothetical protein